MSKWEKNIKKESILCLFTHQWAFIMNLVWKFFFNSKRYKIKLNKTKDPRDMYFDQRNKS